MERGQKAICENFHIFIIFAYHREPHPALFWQFNRYFGERSTGVCPYKTGKWTKLQNSERHSDSTKNDNKIRHKAQIYKIYRRMGHKVPQREAKARHGSVEYSQPTENHEIYRRKLHIPQSGYIHLFKHGIKNRRSMRA